MTDYARCYAGVTPCTKKFGAFTVGAGKVALSSALAFPGPSAIISAAVLNRTPGAIR